MATEALKAMKEQLMSCVQGQLGDISKVDAHELGEAIDMIKDLAEAIYYCTITDSMQKNDQNKYQGETNINYYTTPYYNKMASPDWTREAERTGGYMYYPNNAGGNGNVNYYTEMPRNMMRDPREGRSPMRRRMYM